VIDCKVMRAKTIRQPVSSHITLEPYLKML
jgi:hypothetical protein